MTSPRPPVVSNATARSLFQLVEPIAVVTFLVIFALIDDLTSRPHDSDKGALVIDGVFKTEWCEA